MCCSGLQSCDYFTGKVCKDGVSCSHTEQAYPGAPSGQACYNANIAMVHRGCNGYGSCAGAKLLLVQDACNNKEACGGANSGDFYIEDPVCATQCCNEESECVRNRFPRESSYFYESTADMIDKCGKCTGKQTKPF